MDWTEYTQLARRTANRGPQDTDEQRLINFSMGLAGEAGEVCDQVKKIAFHGHAFDTAKMREEMGDVLWYLAMLAETVGLPLEDIARTNIDKLMQRYPDGFRIEDSIHRSM